MMKKKIFILGALVIFLVAGALIWQEIYNRDLKKTECEEPEDILNDICKNLVRIQAGESSGTGVIIFKNEDYLRIASAGHVVGDFDEAAVIISGSEVLFGNVVYQSDSPDLCFIDIKSENVLNEFWETLSFCELGKENYENLKEDEGVYLIGSVVLNSFTVNEGSVKAKDFYVSDFDMKVLYIYADAFEGMSGGGVFTKSGKLVGLILGANDNSEVCAFPLDQLMDKLKEIE